MVEVRYEGVGRGGTADFVWRPGGRGARIPSLQDILSHLPVLETEGYLSVSSRTGRIKVSQGDLSVSKMVDALSEIDIPRVFAEQTGSLGSPREI